MGLYERVIFPHLCDWFMNDPRLHALRRAALAKARGEVLEIGFGTGLNLPHYPPEVVRVSTADPNAGMSRIANRRVAQSGREVDQQVVRGEQLPFADQAFDCVVSTWTLCSIADVPRALSEIHRVLKRGGRYLFLEHGLSPDPKTQRWQRRLNPIQRCLAGGCRLDLDVGAVLRAQPFESIELERFELDWAPRTHGTMYQGVATKAAGA